jgi:hypothetical protein
MLRFGLYGEYRQHRDGTLQVFSPQTGWVFCPSDGLAPNGKREVIRARAYETKRRLTHLRRLRAMVWPFARVGC